MGGYTPKTAISRLGVREFHLASRDASNHGDRNVTCCNRLGCSMRPNCMKTLHSDTSDRAKYSTNSICSTRGNLMNGSSSKMYSNMHSCKEHRNESQSPSSHKATVPSESNNIQIETHNTDTIPSTTRNLTGYSEADDVESEVLNAVSVNIPEETEGYCVFSNTKTQMRLQRQSYLSNQNSSFGFPNLSSASNKNSHAASSVSYGRSGLRKLGCVPMSDARPSGSSSSHLSHSRRTEAVKKRSTGECASSGKKMSGCGSSSGMSSSIRGSLSSSRLSHCGRPSTQQASKSTRKQSASRDHVSSGSSQKSNGKGKQPSLAEPINVIPHLSRSELSIRVSSPPTSSHQSPTIGQNTYCRTGGKRVAVHNQLTGPVEDDTDSFHDVSIGQDGFRCFNTDGIAEVLSVLERIEQDEELTNEQRLVLESNLFLDGLSFLDQHRDMRMDIENMSYEELLDLEEKIGTVSIALTEEALSNCLKINLYKPTCLDAWSKRCVDDDDVKCSICQEEYTEGDEVGKLVCDHGYHMTCIHQWLQQKNWCPVCKASAAPS